jgi:hypothetical protein
MLLEVLLAREDALGEVSGEEAALVCFILTGGVEEVLVVVREDVVVVVVVITFVQVVKEVVVVVSVAPLVEAVVVISPGRIGVTDPRICGKKSTASSIQNRGRVCDSWNTTSSSH